MYQCDILVSALPRSSIIYVFSLNASRDAISFISKTCLFKIIFRARKSLGKNFWRNRNRSMQSVTRHLFRQMSVDEIKGLEWKNIVKNLDVQTLNSLPPNVVKVVSYLIVWKRGKLTWKCFNLSAERVAPINTFVSHPVLFIILKL